MLNDYVELYNPSEETRSLDGLTVNVYGFDGEYQGEVELSGEPAANDHYLIKLEYSAHDDGGDGTELENFDAENADLGIAPTTPPWSSLPGTKPLTWSASASPIVTRESVPRPPTPSSR